MQTGVTIYGVLIASPGDTQEARVAVREAIALWNASHGKTKKVMLNPVGWESDASPVMGEEAQATINRQLVDDADILVALFHTRLGTPTSAAASGTVEEIDRFLHSSRLVSIYFNTAPLPHDVDIEELARLRDYERTFRTQGLIGSFFSAQELKTLLQRDLTHHVDHLQGDSVQQKTSASSPSEVPQVEATKAFAEAASAAKGAGIAPFRDATPQEPKAIELMIRGEYEKGLIRAREESDKDSGLVSSDWLALLRFVAFREGHVTQALKDLETSIAENPQDVVVRLWYARALQYDGQMEKALEEARRGLRDARSDEERVDAVRIIVAGLISSQRRDEARVLVINELQVVTDLEGRSSLITSLANLLSEKEGAPSYKSLALRELAVSLRPNDTKLHFDLAYAYGNINADKMALVHYEGLLARTSKDGTALNNAGVSADRLDLPLSSVGFYRQAEKVGDSLAIANLTWKLIQAGFEKEANDLIKAARTHDTVHANLEKAAGSLATRLESEAESLKTIREEASEASIERVRYANALITSIDLKGLSATYKGESSDLILTVSANGAATGSFVVAGGRQATLTGRVGGSLLEFSWQTREEEQRARPIPTGLLAGLSIETMKSGTGLLIFDGDGASGYWTTAAGATTELDPPDRSKRVPWTLKKTPTHDSEASA
jgi:tetratricopeptide (TPR) repeat protein